MINIYKNGIRNNMVFQKMKTSPNKKNFSNEQDDMKILREKTDELNRIMRDREYFRYTLNFKGLLLFLILYSLIKKI